MRTETTLNFDCKLGQAYKAEVDFHNPAMGVHTKVSKVSREFKLVTNNMTGVQADAVVAKVELALALEPAVEAPVDFEKTTKISGYDVLLHGEWDGDAFVTWCHISFVDRYCSSLGVVEDYGTIEHDNGGPDMRVPPLTVRAIRQWADDNGY